MRSRKLSAGVAVGAAAALGCLTVVPVAAAAGANSRQTLPGSVPSWARAGALRGTAPGSAPVGFRVYLGWRSDPTAAIRAVSTPGSPQYGRYLTPQQFRAQYSPSQSQVTGVQQWLRNQGFTVDYTPANNLYVSAEGTVAQAEAAFATTLGEYSYKGLTLRSPESALSVPSSLGVQAVLGLDDSAQLTQLNKTTGVDAPPSAGFRNGGPCSAYWDQDDTSNTQEPTPLHTKTGTVTTPSSVTLPSAYGTGPSPYTVCGYTPSQLRGAYGLTAAQTGAHQTVAIIDAYASPTIQTDANTYFGYASVNPNPDRNLDGIIPPLTNQNFQQVVAPGTYRHPESGLKQDPQGWYGEETLDVEAVHTMAPAADIVFVGAPNNFSDLDAALNHVVDRHLASMVTNSYGNSTEDLPPGYILPQLSIMQQAAMEGIGLYFSSGDNGDETGGVAGATPTPDWPASSPLVTAVGGTSLAVDATNARTNEWGWETGISRLTGTSADSLAWTSPAAPPGVYDYGSGGGTSRLFAQPWYQAGVVPTTMSEVYGNTTPARVEPDVAALGDPSTGMLVGQTQSWPDGSTSYGEYRIGGTSLASPLFTGMMADVQAARGTDIGFANPLLYSQASTAGVFDDILPVDQSQPPAVVRSDYANSVDPSGGYTASVRSIDFDKLLTIHVEPGYDDVTGIGSPGTSFFPGLAAAPAP